MELGSKKFEILSRDDPGDSTFPNNWKQKRKKLLDATVSSKSKQPAFNFNVDFPELPKTKPAANSEQKFVIIKAVSDERALIQNVFRTKKAVEDVSSLYSNASFLKDGSLVLMCPNTSVTNKFLNITSLGGIQVQAGLHESLNTSKGTIYAPILKGLSEDEIIDGLKDQGVTQVYKVKKSTTDGYVPSGLLIITFNKTCLPSHIFVGFERIAVSTFYPSPMKCKRCHLLGHTIKRCRSPTEICNNCGSEEHPNESCKRTYCLNCKSTSHPSYHRSCP